MTKRIGFLVFVLCLLAVSTTAQSKLLPGMPAPLDMSDIYSADRPGALNPVVKNFLQRVYVPNTESNTVSVIDPATGKTGATVPVDDPYNLYYTPDGKYAIVVAEQMRRLLLREPKAMAV